MDWWKILQNRSEKRNKNGPHFTKQTPISRNGKYNRRGQIMHEMDLGF